MTRTPLLALIFLAGCLEAVDVGRHDAGIDAGSEMGIDAGSDGGTAPCVVAMNQTCIELSWTPTTLDFGYVQPGLTVSADVTFTNQSFRVIELSGLTIREGTNPSTIYRVTMANLGDLTRLSIPAATRNASTNAIIPGTATVTLSFRPVVLGPRGATLSGSTDVGAQPTFSIPLRGTGGGPDIDLQPANGLDFGRIALFAGSPSSATRRVTLRNVGTRPMPPDPRGNLKLGVRGEGPPYWSVIAKNAESSLSEICVGRFDTANGTCIGDLPTTGTGSYNPAVGIEASATLDIPIRITPANTRVGASGNKEWEVTFFSNDPDEPEVRLTVTARPVTLAPCNFAVRPTSLDFGNVTPPFSRDLTFQVCNLAPATATGDRCLVTNLELGPGSDVMFSLPGGALQERELAPQECLTVVTRAWPQVALPATPTTVSGSVTFSISSPQGPQPRVQLTAMLAAAVCTSGVAMSCNDEPVDGGIGGLAGVCVNGGCACNPGFEVNPRTGLCRATRPTTSCTVGMNQTCNADPLMSGFAGMCVAGTCACSAGFALTSSGTCTASSTTFCVVSDGMGGCTTETLDGGSSGSGRCGTVGITAGCTCSGMPLCGGLCPPTAGRTCLATNCGSINCQPPLRCTSIDVCAL
ncbi:MAG: hypothetical protein Q8L14_42955 [Myxococcales bacterium]|nr:hypothetical protein [Myxococcales bacterium]